jgi:hypothetical protein
MDTIGVNGKAGKLRITGRHDRLGEFFMDGVAQLPVLVSVTPEASHGRDLAKAGSAWETDARVFIQGRPACSALVYQAEGRSGAP